MSPSTANSFRPDWRHAASFSVVLGFVVAIEHWIGWRSLLAPWAVLSPFGILTAIALVTLTYVTRALRLYRHFESGLDFELCLHLLLRHNFLVNVLPMRTGEIAFPVLMQRYFGIPARRSVPTLLWLRALDLHMLILLLGGTIAWHYAPPFAIAFALTWLGVLFAAFVGAQSIIARLDGRVDRFSWQARDALLALPQSVGAFTESWFWTMLNWVIKVVVFAWILSLFASLTFQYSLVGAIGGEFASVLPIHGPAGIGTYPAGVAAAVIPSGITLQEAMRGGVNLHLFVLGVSTFGGLVALIARRPRVQHRVDPA